MKRPNGSPSSLSPTGASYMLPQINIGPADIRTGRPVVLPVSSDAFDLSGVAPNQISITPANGVSGIQIAGVTATGLTVSFELTNSAEPGPRTLAITGGDISVSKTFLVNQGPAMRISRPTPVANAPGTATVNVTAQGGADFSTVTAAAVTVSSPDFALNHTPVRVLAVGNITPTSMTITLGGLNAGEGFMEATFGLSLTVKAKNDVLRGQFRARGVHGGSVYRSNEHCCHGFVRVLELGRCPSCLPDDQLCN